MGTLCIIIGIILFIGATGGGYLLANKLANYQIMGQSLLGFMGVSSASSAYIYIVIPCAVIGLLICFSFVMIGVGCKRTAALERRVRAAEKALKKIKKASASDIEEADTEA